MPYLNNDKTHTIAGIFSQPGISYKEAVSKLEKSGMHTAVEIRNDPDKTEPDICIDIKDGSKNILNISVPFSKTATGLNWVSIISEKLGKVLGNVSGTSTADSDKPAVPDNPAPEGKTARTTNTAKTETKAATKKGPATRKSLPLPEPEAEEPAQVPPESSAKPPEPQPGKKADAGRVRVLDASIWDDDLWSEENTGIIAEEYEKDPVEEKETVQGEKTQENPHIVKEETLAQSEDVVLPVEREEPSSETLPDNSVDPEDTKKALLETDEDPDDPGRTVLGISAMESDLLIGGIMASLNEMSDTEIENCAVESWNEEGAGYASLDMGRAKEEEKKPQKIQPDGKDEENTGSDIGAPSASGEVDLKKIANETDFSAFDDIL